MFGKKSKRVTAAWWATVVLFLVHGLVVSTFVSRIPALQAHLRIDNGILGLTLLSSALGAVCCIPFAGWLITRYGSKKITEAASVAFCFSLMLLGFAANVAVFALALFVYGSTAAAMDVGMNAHGVEVEKEQRAPTMSRFHAMFSLGGMIGAGVGGWLASRGLTPSHHFTLSACFNIIAVLLASRSLLSTSVAPSKEHSLPLNKIPTVLLALSAIGFCILLAEGAMADWTAVYLRQALAAGAGIAADGYSVFSAAMAVFRFLGDRITAILGPQRAVLAGSLVASAGLTWALCAHSPLWALPGFATAGAGFSVIIPLVFGSAGRVEGVNSGAGIATVTGIGYFGFIAGPPAIGFLSRLVTLRYALFLVVGCCLISALLSRAMRRVSMRQSTEPIAEFHF